MHFKYFSIKEIQNFINENNLAILKKFGQNFLINAGVADTIINNANIKKEDLIIEIGCGLGGLTHKLIDTKAKIIGFEIDAAFIKILKKQFSNFLNFTLIEGDFLKKIEETFLKIDPKKFNRILILGNIPYQITTPILEKLFLSDIYFDEIILMIQKEVAERITSKEGNKKYGSLSIFCQYFTSPKVIAHITPRSFYPSPNVESTVVNFKKRTDKPDVLDIKLFFNLSRSLFINRRKQLKNNLLLSPFLKSINKESLVNALENVHISTMLRGEMLPINKIIELANEIYRLNQ